MKTSLNYSFGFAEPQTANRRSGLEGLRSPRLDHPVTASAGEALAFLGQGDAFDLIPTLTPNTIDLLITSPPYWGQRTYNKKHNWNILREWAALGHSYAEPLPYEWYRSHGGVLGLEPLPEWYISHLVEILGRARAALRPHGSLWINLGDTYFARWSSIRDKGRQGLGDNSRERRRTPMGGFRQEKQLLLIPARFAIAMQDCRWILRNDLIWFKPNVPPRPEADRLRLAHEHFFHFVKRPAVGRPKYYYDILKTEPGAMDVVCHPARPGRDGHTATFPEEVITPRILSSCPPGGTVLDPFCGTGRALAVAVRTGRRAIGFDISPEYIKSSAEVLRSLIGANDRKDERAACTKQTGGEFCK